MLPHARTRYHTPRCPPPISSPVDIGARAHEKGDIGDVDSHFICAIRRALDVYGIVQILGYTPTAMPPPPCQSNPLSTLYASCYPSSKRSWLHTRSVYTD